MCLFGSCKSDTKNYMETQCVCIPQVHAMRQAQAVPKKRSILTTSTYRFLQSMPFLLKGETKICFATYKRDTIKCKQVRKDRKIVLMFDLCCVTG